MTVIIDRRNEPSQDRYGTDRQRFRQRYLDLAKQAVQDQVAKGGMKDFEKGGITIPIPADSLKQPTIHHSSQGLVRRVFPGNLSYEVGDLIPKPSGGGGQGPGSGGGNTDANIDGKDAFIWLSPEELLSILFEGRKLPDMTKLKGENTKVLDLEHAGYTNKGPSHKMDWDKTNKKRREESIPLGKVAERQIVKNLTEQFNILASCGGLAPALQLAASPNALDRDSAFGLLQTLAEQFSADLPEGIEKAKLSQILAESVDLLRRHLDGKISDESQLKRLSVLQLRLKDQTKAGAKSANFRSEHLTYKYDDDVPTPNAKAVMFCLMDVSYSMSQEMKNTAKSFFWLLNRFLNTNYEQVDVVFLTHTTTAKEVDEKEFFQGQDSGGTLVSSVLAKMKDVIAERYPASEWNIYGAQASDGDTVDSDNRLVNAWLDKLLPDCQAFYYAQVGSQRGAHTLMQVYKNSAAKHSNLHLAQVESPAQALDAFKKLFPINQQQPAASGPSSFLNPT